MREDIYLFSQYVNEGRETNVLMSGVSYCDKTYRIERSRYDYFVIEYTVEGEGALETDGRKYTLRGGDVYFLYKGKGHKYYCSGESWKKIWVVVYGDVIESLFNAYLPSRPNVLYGLDIECEMCQIIELVKSGGLTYGEMADKVALCVHGILMKARESAAKESGVPQQLCVKIKSYIDGGLKKPLDLNALSESLFYSKNHVINVFRNEYGVTPYVYYEKQRMYAAAEMLKSTSLTVSEIAAEYGFDNVQCFSKSFKRIFSVSPAQYRKAQS